MTKENQIEEMAKAIEEARIKASDTTNSMNYGFGGWYAKELYAKGYRKASDVAREIVDKVALIVSQGVNIGIQRGVEMADAAEIEIYIIAILDELKKKYTESEDVKSVYKHYTDTGAVYITSEPKESEDRK
jgi:hypothetical protein